MILNTVENNFYAYGWIKIVDEKIWLNKKMKIEFKSIEKFTIIIALYQLIIIVFILINR